MTETPFSVECSACRKQIDRKFDETCNACHQLEVCKCEDCTKDPRVAQRTLLKCGGCGYAVCAKHSRRLVFKELMPLTGKIVDRSEPTCLCAPFEREFHCRDLFLGKMPEELKKRAWFSADWFGIDERPEDKETVEIVNKRRRGEK